MKTLSILTLSIMLAACGGESSSSSSEIDQKTEEKIGVSFSDYESLCGDESILPAKSGSIVSDDNQQYRIEADANDATVEIKDSNSVVCVYGDFPAIAVTGSGHEVYVNGGVKYLAVSGDNHKVIVFGEIQSVEIDGNSNNVRFEAVATISEIGQENSIMNISNANL